MDGDEQSQDAAMTTVPDEQEPSPQNEASSSSSDQDFAPALE